MSASVAPPLYQQHLFNGKFCNRIDISTGRRVTESHGVAVRQRSLGFRGGARNNVMSHLFQRDPLALGYCLTGADLASRR